MTDVYIFAEGRTERLFIERLLCPYCSAKGVYLHATLVHGQRNRMQGGGDVNFERIHADIAAFLKQRPDTLVATFVDFYGIKEWPNLDRARALREPADIARLLNAGAVEQMQALHPDIERIPERYIPFTAVHEFESLLMSNPAVLAKALGVPAELVQNAVDQAGGPEYVNNSPKPHPPNDCRIGAAKASAPRTGKRCKASPSQKPSASPPSAPPAHSLTPGSNNWACNSPPNPRQIWEKLAFLLDYGPLRY